MATVTGLEGRTTINKDYATAFGASGLSAADYAKTPEFQGFQNKLNDNYNSVTDPGTIDSELAYHQGRVNDPVAGPSAQAFVTTLQARKAALAPSSPSSGTSAPPAGAPAPGLAATASPSPYKPSGVPTGNPGQDTTGNYVPQDQSVESRIPGLMSTDNPIVQTAVGQSIKAANARGLVNSTLAVQAGTQAAEASVLPIASQDAAQVAAQNTAAQGAAQTGALQQQQIGGTIQTTGMTIQAQKDQLNTQIAAQNQQLATSLGSQANLQAAQIAANKFLQGESLNAQETMLVQQLNSAMKQAQLTTDTQKSIAASGITQAQQQQVLGALGQYAAIYQDGVNQVNNNANLSYDARTTALTQLAADYSSHVNLVSSLYSVELRWTTTSPTTGAAETHTATPTPHPATTATT